MRNPVSCIKLKYQTTIEIIKPILKQELAGDITF